MTSVTSRQQEDGRVSVAAGPATVYEAAQGGVLPPAIKPVSLELQVRGPAFPVRCAPGTNVWLHRAVYAAQPGDVLVVDVGGAYEYGYWGEILSVAASVRGLGGVVVDGGTRDRTQTALLGFPIFGREPCIRGTGKDPDGGGFGPVTIGDVTVERGDLVVGDADGVVVVEAARTEEVLSAADRRERDESRIMQRLRAGETTLDIFGLA